MQTIGLGRSSIDNMTPDSDHGADPDAHPADAPTGFTHLLRGLTLDSVLAQTDHWHQPSMQSFLLDGVVPPDKEALSHLAIWMVQHAQASILNALQGFGELVVPVSDERTATGLLKAMQSGLSFSNLKVQLITSTRKEDLDAVIPLLAGAFMANSSLTALILYSNDYRARGLQPLSDVLAGVKYLQLSTAGDLLHPADVAVISSLLAHNKNLCSLELHNLLQTPADDEGAADASTALTNLFRHLGTQSRLERLVLGAVPEHSQSPLGAFLASCHSLVQLEMNMNCVVATEPLLAGLRENNSIEKCHLIMAEMSDGILPLLVALAGREGTLKNLGLTTLRCRADVTDSDHIARLIACNSSLESVTWTFSEPKSVDLARFGKPLEKNQRLETLCLVRQINLHRLPDPGSYRGDWVDKSMSPSIIASLKKNRTLTKLVLTDSSPFSDMTPVRFPMLQQVLDRNHAWKTFACSNGYICGAVVGFFASVGMPVETAVGTADCLLEHKPRVSVGALALVNKTTHESAVAGRRAAHPAALNQTLAALPDFNFSTKASFLEKINKYLPCGNPELWEVFQFKPMTVLLTGIATSADDFSEEDLRRIANRPTLGPALVVMMKRSESIYCDLIKRFCEAAGKDVIRSMVTSSMPSSITASERQWQILKQSFKPDQQHLLPFVEGAFDYDQINSQAVLGFIGYNTAPDLDEEAGKEFMAWCIKNQAPGALMACHNTLKSEFLEATAGQFSSKFLQGMIEKIPLLPHLTELCLKGNFGPDDALVLQRVLTTQSALEELNIEDCNGGGAFDLIMQGLMLNETITEILVSDLAVLRISPICEVVRAVLACNATIGHFVMLVFPTTLSWII